MFFYGSLTSLPLFIITPWQFPLEHFLTDMPVTLNLLFLGFLSFFDDLGFSFVCRGFFFFNFRGG